MAESIITFNVADMEPIKNLIDALGANINKLPPEVIAAMENLASHSSKENSKVTVNEC